MASVTKFSPKDPIETVLITFDFSQLFVDAGERILTVDWSVETVIGVDAHPSNMKAGLASFNNTTTSHLITGGEEGRTYHIHAVVNTNKGQVLKMTGSMLVQAQGH